ncbi:MAG: DUF2062 domain-containing protein, partial [Nitrospirae bacterium]|nr:DUF2062 domain-containing protein [Nitrospirota bacterium]
SNVMRELGAFLIPFIVGETVAALFGGVLGYFIMLYIFRFRHRKKPSETMA